MNGMPESPKVLPSPDDFQNWLPGQVASWAGGKTLVFAPGGTSRWYFLEYGDTRVGYGERDQFLDYGRRAVRRTVELLDMIFRDGISTIFVVGNTPEQDTRNLEYTNNLAWSYGVIADETSQDLYAKYDIGVLFRGAWEQSLARLGASGDILASFREVEAKTAHRERWMIWLAYDNAPIPQSLAPLVADSIQKTGMLPDRATLCQAYYGRPLQYADIFLSNNKPSTKHMCPPLMVLGDLYFTVNPSYYMDQWQWRHILYDHLFARRRHYRDYKTFKPDVMDEMRSFYAANQGVTLGVGTHHAISQTWRPTLPSSLQHHSSHED